MLDRILIHAPRGRDASVIQNVLLQTGIAGVCTSDLAALRSAIEEGASGVIVTEEALAGPDLEPLLRWCEAQPSWSDLPIIVMAVRQSGHRSARASGILDRLGNVVLLERPVNSETLTSAARSAARMRARQHQTRTLLTEREQRGQELRALNDHLEQRVQERTQALDQAHETLAFALQSAGLGSWDIDFRTGVSRRTSAHDRIFGYSALRTDWSPEIFLEHVVEEDRRATARAFIDAMVSGVLDHECRIRRSDGALRWIAVKGRTGYDEAGVPVRMAGLAMDNTDRRYADEALHQAQKMEAIGQLTGGVAHDFNNLLTVVIGATELIARMPSLPPRAARLADAAMTAARRGEQLTQQLLSFSRRQMLRPQISDPNHLLREVDALAQRAVGEAVTLRFDLAPDAGAILIDPAQFESAVLNLVVNARDAMPDGGVVTISSRNLAAGSDEIAGLHLPPGACVRITVSDTGSGIDAATLARVCEPFFTTKEVGKGSGLGLSQVYGFTRSAGGDLAIASQPGRGTTVSLYFPRSAERPSEERHMQPASATVAEPEPGQTVLLVEDDEQVRVMAVESLRELRYRVIVAGNAQEALAHIEQPACDIDIMFSDVVMPGGMNGMQLASEARKRRPGLRVLLTSGFMGEIAGMDGSDRPPDLLSKPYRREELARRLRELAVEQA